MNILQVYINPNSSLEQIKLLKGIELILHAPHESDGFNMANNLNKYNKQNLNRIAQAVDVSSCKY